MSPRSDQARVEKVATSDLLMNGRSLKRIRRWQRRIWRVSDEGQRIRETNRQERVERVTS